MGKKLEQYSGALSREQIAHGMNLAKKNARRLFEDADVLFQAGRLPSAMSLAILSIEESGKVNILRRMSTETTPEAQKALWKEYRSHTRKNLMWTLPSYVKWDEGTKLQDFAPMFDESSDHPFLLDQVKQLAFYSDCLGKGKWTDPVDVIDREFAESILTAAKVQSAGRDVTPRELELWQEHLGSAGQGMAQGLLNWYAAMHAEGLVEGDADQMLKFVTRGIEVGDKPEQA